jgi:hypothetical protein
MDKIEKESLREIAAKSPPPTPSVPKSRPPPPPSVPRAFPCCIQRLRDSMVDFFESEPEPPKKIGSETQPDEEQEQETTRRNGAKTYRASPSFRTEEAAREKVHRDMEGQFNEPDYHEIGWVKELMATFEAHKDDLKGHYMTPLYRSDFQEILNHLLAFLGHILESTMTRERAIEFSADVKGQIEWLQENHPMVGKAAYYADRGNNEAISLSSRHYLRLAFEQRNAYENSVINLNRLREKYGGGDAKLPLSFVTLDEAKATDIMTQRNNAKASQEDDKMLETIDSQSSEDSRSEDSSAGDANYQPKKKKNKNKKNH